MKNTDTLNLFHPLISIWFKTKFKKPTDIQNRAWPKIIQGENVVITAPTGSGKTLTAFLWAINKLLTGEWQKGTLSVLYISPLKALNKDVKQNLLTPLGELDNLFESHKIVFPKINVVTRSGDTSQSERRRMITHPPEILITTPESLNLLISSIKARPIFNTLKTVILDEIHAIVSSKRGTHLITAVDRLTLLAGEFQRIALSATVKPLDIIADFTCGYRITRLGEKVKYTKRPVITITSEQEKKIELKVAFPEDAREKMVDKTWWPAFIESFKNHIRQNRSTLLFTNTRKLSEKISRFINDKEEEIIAYSHHGSLSKEIRSVVENKLKNGELKAIIATSSLELGIDIGYLDEVILVETPASVSSSLQRIGRAGHNIDDVTKGTIYPIHGRDLLAATVMAKCILDKDIEESKPVLSPLDVLAQIILSMSCMQTWNIDDLFTFIKSSYPYHTLSRKEFDLVINMLAGKYKSSRIRELKPRISIDNIANTITGKKGALSIIYLSGGMIPDRGYYDVRVTGSNMKVGDLEEEFVWERHVGDVFALGTQVWKIVSIDQRKLEVIPWQGKINTLPFWKADLRNAGFHFQEKVALFLEKWSGKIDSTDFKETLSKDYCMSEPAITELINYLKLQIEATGTELPNRHHIIIEYCSEGINNTGEKRCIIHTLWGSKINHPLSLAISAFWEQKFGQHLEVFSDNFCIMLLLHNEIEVLSLFSLVNQDNIEQLLRNKLETTGFFGAHFRMNAGRALLLPKAGFGKRMPLWLTRLRSKNLFEGVLRFEDFPIIYETWRSCVNDDFDLQTLYGLLDEINTGEIRLTEVTTKKASPFASGLIWRQVEKHIYQGDKPESGRLSNLDDKSIKELIYKGTLRPLISKKFIKDFQDKLQRLTSSYSPKTSMDLNDWVKERIIIPEKEWEAILYAIKKDHNVNAEDLLISLDEKLAILYIPGAAFNSIVSIEMLPHIIGALGLSIKEVNLCRLKIKNTDKNWGEKIDQHLITIKKNSNDYNKYTFADLFSEWLRFYGPIKTSYIQDVFNISAKKWQDECSEILDDKTILLDVFSKGEKEIEVCDAKNLEILLRLARKAARPSIKPLSSEYLILFLLEWQNLNRQNGTEKDLKYILEKLFGFAAPASIWETDIFTARLPEYSPHWLDRLITQSDLIWFGSEKEKVSFCFHQDLDLFFNIDEKSIKNINLKYIEKKGKYSFWELLDFTKLNSHELTKILWQYAWNGILSNDCFDVVRKGIENRFSTVITTQKQRIKHYRRKKNLSFDRWKSSRPGLGYWFVLDPEPLPEDAIFLEELRRDRIRQLLSRYGILFRELLDRELPVFRWNELYKTLRIMELSGEIHSGHFFKDIGGPQFISIEALKLLSAGLDTQRIYWINALDPASPCGIKAKDGFPDLPDRKPSTHIVFHGSKPVLISRKKGKELEIRISPESTNIHRYLGFFNLLLNRAIRPFKSIKVEKVNGEPAGSSPYGDILKDFGFEKDFNRYILRGGY